MKGTFLPFYLPFIVDGVPVSPGTQASIILDEAEKQLARGAAGFAITYSANLGQTHTIYNTYASGKWHTHTSGANQAEVMRCMEEQMETVRTSLQHKVRIAPVTTLSFNGFQDRSHRDLVTGDLQAIRGLLLAGWTVAGWMNQFTRPGFAIGGGVARLPADLSAFIQERLHALEHEFPL